MHFLVKNLSKKAIKSVIFHTVLHVFRRWLLLPKNMLLLRDFLCKIYHFLSCFPWFFVDFCIFFTFLLHILYETYRVQLFTKINQQKYSLLLDKRFIFFYLKITKIHVFDNFSTNKVIKITKLNKQNTKYENFAQQKSWKIYKNYHKKYSFVRAKSHQKVVAVFLNNPASG